MHAVDKLLEGHRLCVYATGSYGRLEAWDGSDIDLFFLYDDAEESERLPWITFTRLSARLVEETEDMGFPPFSGDGRYLEVLYVGEMEQILGSPEDDSQNSFTARMLLLLESQPVYREDVHKALLERIVGFYYRDFDDHADRFLPTFLTNDILRFWRTLTLNYEHHRIKILTDGALTEQELPSAEVRERIEELQAEGEPPLHMLLDGRAPLHLHRARHGRQGARALRDDPKQPVRGAP